MWRCGFGRRGEPTSSAGLGSFGTSGALPLAPAVGAGAWEVKEAPRRGPSLTLGRMSRLPLLTARVFAGAVALATVFLGWACYVSDGVAVLLMCGRALSWLGASAQDVVRGLYGVLAVTCLCGFQLWRRTASVPLVRSASGDAVATASIGFALLAAVAAYLMPFIAFGAHTNPGSFLLLFLGLQGAAVVALAKASSYLDADPQQRE